jgi:prolyl 4-hydroxylase
MERITPLPHKGFAKVPIPSHTFRSLQQFWQRNYRFCWPEFHAGGLDMSWYNHWESPTFALEVGRNDLLWSLTDKREGVVQEVQQALEELTLQKLVFQASVGIRAYSENAVLAPHLDQLPFAITAVLHIAENNVAEPWPLQLVKGDEDGNPTITNITTVPGEMVIYEGASVIHGRPFPLTSSPSGKEEDGENPTATPQQLCTNTITQMDEKGMYTHNATYDPTYMAVLYLHFEPIGYTAQHALKQQEQHDNTLDSLYYGTPVVTSSALDHASKAAFEKALHVQRQSNEKRPPLDPDVPLYVWKEYTDTYQQKFVFSHEPAIYPKSTKVVLGTITAHQAAALGDVDALKSIAKTDRSQLFKADMNGWRPLHEAARSGYADALEYLLEEGAQVNARTNDNKGGTALYWAEKKPKENAKAIAVLKRYGGVNIAPAGYKDED